MSIARSHAKRPTRVASIPGIMGGEPCIEGTRVPAETILVYINEGATPAELLDDYPYLPADAMAVVQAWAASRSDRR